MVMDATRDKRLSPDELYRPCAADQLGFETTAEVAPADGTVGQERALHSLEFGLEIKADGYNLFVSGPVGTGRNSTLRAVVRRIAAERPVPPDWCYVYNFDDHRQPSVISLPAGRGPALVEHMDTFIEACRREIPRHFETEAYVKNREELAHGVGEQREQAFAAVEQQARQRGFTLNVGPMGVATVPLKPDGQPMSREEFAQLPEAERQALHERGEELQSLISQAMLQARRLEREAQGRLEELDKAVAKYAITPLLNELRQEYIDIPKAVEYLDHVQDDIVEHLESFRPTEGEPQVPTFMRPPAEEFFTRYKVNAIVSRDATKGAPVFIENNPTYYNLFGRVDFRSQLGAATTDHTMIKAGAIHHANGGYLILQAYDALITPLVWETLKRTIRCREARIENLGEQYSAIPVATLAPQPIPLDVKVVLVGNPRIYQALQVADEEFRKLFRVKADFTVDMDRNPECLKLYAGFISSRVRNERLRQFHKSAVARVVEHGSRLVEHQGKLSTRFIDIGDLLTEANFWAGEDGSELVYDRHVERAIEEKVYRSNLVEERVQEVIEDGTILIDTDGAVAGQVNGISVYELGDYRFGRPSRITARVSLGRGQVVSIEREIHLSGPIHNKGFMILNGYLQGKFAQERPLSLGASIGFEQTYDEVEGDSASAAELYALLSALSGVPIKQGVAVTGSVNQLGEVQAIGGVNEKIEGFYAVCKAKGLTGEQGVAIPRENVKHLMLRKEVVDAVREGRFHVWAVSNVDEGIEILTGVAAGPPDARGRYPSGTINRRAMDRLAQMARRLAAAARQGRPRDDGQAASGAGDQEKQTKT
jgi:lon-related putative ATP-dependent protease